MNLREAIRRSIRNKVLALVIGTTALALLLATAALVIYDLRAYERQSANDLFSQAEVIARATAPALSFQDSAAATQDLSVMRVRPRVVVAALYGRGGIPFARYVKPGESALLPERPGVDGYTIGGGYIATFKRVIENGEPIGTVYIRAVYDPWSRLVDYVSLLFIVMLASLGAAILLLGRLQDAVTRPILEVASAARGVVAKRDYSLRVRKDSEDEVGELVDAFNSMMAEIGRRTDALRDADRRKDEFLATLAHELRNPLAPLRNALEIQRLTVGDEGAQRRAREMMERQMKQMVRLVDDLLDVSRITTGKLTVRRVPLDLQQAVADAVELSRPLIEARGHAFSARLAPGTVPVDGDRTRLAQVFSNLLNNAAKYTNAGGRIELSVEVTESHAIVRVRDNGIGLDADSISRIFEMFVQVDRRLERSQAGLGVGLSLARRLVELHDGVIEARSEGEGMGSQFEVKLPLSGARIDVPESGAGGENAASRVRRILLADDNVDFAVSLGALLKARGHDVKVVHDGAEALKAAAEFRPEIAFLDIGMPQVHGYEVARRMRQSAESSRCVLIAVTGWGQESDRKRAREAGFDKHLTKPVDPNEISKILEGV